MRSCCRCWAACCCSSFLNELFGEKRWGFTKYIAFLEANGRTFVELVGILAGCGLLIGAFSLTGVISSLANDLLRSPATTRCCCWPCAPSPA